MRGAVAALLAIFMLILGFFFGLSVNPSQPAMTKLITSTTTITVPSMPLEKPTSITSSIIEFAKETITTWLTRHTSITEKITRTITEKITKTMTTMSTFYATIPKTITTTSTTTITSHITSTSIITSTETATTYLTSTKATTLTSYTTKTTTATKTTTTTSTIYTTKTVTTTETAESIQIESAEVDLVATVYKVIDGDTFDAFPSGRVRLADINAPELDEAGGHEAKEALTNLVLNKKVYLDVDDLYVMDKYNRLICVVYVDYNSTHVLNVNKWLIENGYAEIADYDNEFDPSTWRLYNKKM